MADAGGNAANAADGQPRPQGNSMIGMVIRLAMMYFMMQYMRSGKKESTDAGGGVPTREKLLPYMSQLEPVNFEVFVSNAPGTFGKRVWHEKRIPLAAVGFKRRTTVMLTHEDLSPVWAHNQTLHLVTRFSRSSLDLLSGPDKPMRVRGHASTKSIRALLQENAPPQKATGKSLLGLDFDAAEEQTTADGMASQNAVLIAASVEDSSILDGDDDAQEGAVSQPEGPWLPFLKPNLTISMVNDFAAHGTAQLPPHFLENVDISFDESRFHPIVHISEFWLLRDYLVPLNDTVTTVALHLELDTMHSMWWQGMLAFQMSFDLQKSNGILGEREIEEVKRIFLEGNPYLLALTMVVSLLHTVFDALAFKNDIGFWKDNKSMEGLSARTIIINAFCQFIIFLYLLDNETSTVVLLSAGVGCAIEFWKVTKVMDIRLEQRPNGLPKLTIKDRGSYVKTKTREYDEEATRYMSYALIPMVICYFIYSLIYDKYKSWYSFVLQTLVGCVYAFGFVLMCPQLYLNYKLKSVAHLPWRQMTYKFLNTIIDDLFAFVIKMPILHRLSVFRDDVIFLIYLYQRWIYRVDKSRVNEFGFTGDGPEPVEGTESAEPSAIADGGAQDTSQAASTAAAGSGTAIGKATSRRKGSKQAEAGVDDAKSRTEASKDK